MGLANEFRKLAAAARQTSDPVADVEDMGSKGQSTPAFAPKVTATKAAAPAAKAPAPAPTPAAVKSTVQSFADAVSPAAAKGRITADNAAGKATFDQHVAKGGARVKQLKGVFPEFMAKGELAYKGAPKAPPGVESMVSRKADPETELFGQSTPAKKSAIDVLADAVSPAAAAKRNAVGNAAGQETFKKHLGAGGERVKELESKFPEWMAKGKEGYEEKARLKTPSVLAALDTVNPEAALERANDKDPIFQALRATSPESARKRIAGTEKPIPTGEPLARGLEAIAKRSAEAKAGGNRSATRTEPITGSRDELSRALKTVRERSRSPSSLRNMVYGTQGDRHDERIAREVIESLKAMDKFVDYKAPSLQELMDKRKRGAS